VSNTLAPRLVLVTRETDYDQLLARHATRGQAEAFLRRRAESLDGLDIQRDRMRAILAEIRAGLPKSWRIAGVRRSELDRFLFAPEDVVIAVGQDGLVANVAKYLSGQPVIGVNADPARNAGVLVPHTATAAVALLPAAAAGTLQTESRTMVQAELDDGQILLALNEIFVGHVSHQSARYNITYAGKSEAQSSSGLIVASGTGATGWALSIGRATGIAVNIRPDEPAAFFLVREPWPSRTTGATINAGRLDATDQLLIASRMNEGGVVFADGIEGDRLDFAWGRALRVSIARQQLHFVPGETTLSPPPRKLVARTVPIAKPTIIAAPAKSVLSKPALPPRRVQNPRALWIRRIIRLITLLLILGFAIYSLK
jgi:hypothetical protein